jgi:hypothetical protein
VSSKGSVSARTLLVDYQGRAFQKAAKSEMWFNGAMFQRRTTFTLRLAAPGYVFASARVAEILREDEEM